ncbi:Glycolate dehydrogenase (EC, iron-sulfur subunit GlcF, partial [uncultured Gammaproteobacteria bacterium]
LTKLGYKVEETPQKQCCGAVDQHLSANDEALQKIKKNIDAWHPFEVIISSASGCGVMVKDYGSLFDKDDVYYQKAQTVSQNTCDIAQFLADKDLSIFKTLNQTITYHSPCTMQHGQQLGGLVESILKRLGYEPSTVADAHLCCGSAGTYSIFQPKLSQQLKINKLKNLQASSPEMIVTANIGCLMHLQKGTKIPVKHWIELLGN